MKERILRATPLSIAAAAVLPVAAAIAAFGDELLFPAVLFTAIAAFLGWCWMVGEALNGLIPADRRPSLLGLRLCVIGCIAYAAAMIAGSAGVGPLAMARFPLGAMVLHVAAALAVVQIARIVATNLSLAEAEAQLPPMSWGATTLALSPIAGMPLLQRRIRRLFVPVDRDR